MLSPSHNALGGLGDAVERGYLAAVLNGLFGRSFRQSITRILIRATNDLDFYAFGLDPNCPCQDKQPDLLFDTAARRAPRLGTGLEYLFSFDRIGVFFHFKFDYRRCYSEKLTAPIGVA